MMSMSVCESVCLSVIISQESDVEASVNFLCMLPLSVTQSFYGGVATCYVFLVPWMTSCFT